MSVNKVILVGRLGSDPEFRVFPDGAPLATTSIATSESWKDRRTGERVERTEWHRIVFHGGLAEIANQHLSKGDQVYIEGKLQTRKWKDKGGDDRYTTEVIAKSLTMLGSANHQQPDSGADDYDDDIPMTE